MIMFTCGCRSFGPDNADHWRKDGTCSYCGSMRPDKVLAGIEAGEYEFGPTDKSYKAYVHSAVTPERTALAKEAARKFGVGKMLIERQGEAAFEEWWSKEVRNVSGDHVGKFYFQHLDEGQRKHFIHLHNTGKMKLGFPGRFYVMPYFCRTLDH